MQQLVYIQNRVNNAAVRRVNTERGLFYIVPSFTLPFDVVMNSGLYPAEEIRRSYKTLEDTPAPAGHPYDESGQYISASSPDGTLFFQCGIFNKNVRLEESEEHGFRVYVEKHIHVDTAMQTERGRKIIEAIDRGEPVHTSTGVLCEPVQREGVNAKGKRYSWVATEMMFDHDAILVDEEGAATPADGVGLLVNKHLFKTVRRKGSLTHVNTVVNESMNDMRELVAEAVSSKYSTEEHRVWLEDWGHDYAVFETRDGSMKVEFEVTDDNVTFTSEPVRVRRVTSWEVIETDSTAVTTTNQEGNNMSLKTLMKEKLGDAYNEDMTDEEIVNAYEKSLKGNAAEQPTEPKGEQSKPAGELEVNADVQKLIDDSVAKALKANQAAAEKVERDAIAEQLKANGIELTADEQAVMSVNSLKALADKTSPKRNSYGVAGGQPVTNSDDFGDTSMPNVEG